LRSPEEAAVTPEETQTEIKSLRAQMLQLRQQQEDQKSKEVLAPLAFEPPALDWLNR
jgi:hypothetical protein